MTGWRKKERGSSVKLPSSTLPILTLLSNVRLAGNGRSRCIPRCCNGLSGDTMGDEPASAYPAFKGAGDNHDPRARAREVRPSR